MAEQPEPVPAEAQVTMFDGPSFYASGMQVSVAANEAIMTFTKIATGAALLDGQPATVAQSVPLANITVNIITLKEMTLAIQGIVDDWEKENGEIVSPFLRARREA
jgi:hypothetical protein